MATNPERRLGARYPVELAVELHSGLNIIPTHALDVSKHGLFVACSRPPALHQSILIAITLRNGSFETLATVARRVEDQRHGPMGAGLKLFCLGAEAKDRWDRFVAGLESPGLDLPTRPMANVAACFLVHPENPAALLTFFNQNVLASRTLFVTPALRLVGAEVSFVLVHPHTHEEHVQQASVVEWNPDQPQRMGVRFSPVDAAGRRAFLKFLGPMPVATPAPMEPLERARTSEYAFFSPKLNAQAEIVLLLEDEVIEKEDLFDFTWTNKEPKQ
ncbi:MAG: PilZ domain-containing protein [Deltaproteobacteria bacterium]|nr:PilZ domain-containing protein [Deltaproteobacteria bacterium]